MIHKTYFVYGLLLLFATLGANNPDYQDILELEQVAFLDCMFTDFDGHSKEITIPRGRIDTAMQYGLVVDGSSIAGMANDLLLKLHMDTLTLVPWTDTDSKTARVMCNICHDLQTPHEHDVRSMLEQALNEAHTMGYDFFVGPQLEFVLCNEHYDDNNKYIPYDSQSYCASEQNPYATSLKRTLLNILLAQNIPVEKIHHQVAPGQYEITIKYNDALTIADQLIITKQTIRTLANAHSLNVTFMPKPFENHPGNGMHIHCSLWDRATQQNIFYDASDTTHLSPTAKHFIAGILAHINEFTILFNPTINSYKRLTEGKNKNIIRIPSIHDEQAARIEFRSADPLCCPYLAFTILLKLGLEGIKNKTSLTDVMENNQLPSSFEHALTMFKQSSCAKEIVGTTLHAALLSHKKQEFIRYNSFVTNWELNTYFES